MVTLTSAIAEKLRTAQNAFSAGNTVYRCYKIPFAYFELRIINLEDECTC